MTTLTSETTFNILAAPEHFEEAVDLYLYPENAGTLALRELRYPGDLLPPFIYEENPDRWENFDSAPMTDRPQVKVEPTLSWAQVVQWCAVISRTSRSRSTGRGRTTLPECQPICCAGSMNTS